MKHIQGEAKTYNERPLGLFDECCHRRCVQVSTFDKNINLHLPYLHKFPNIELKCQDRASYVRTYICT
jgi:hypothetical protein